MTSKANRPNTVTQLLLKLDIVLGLLFVVTMLVHLTGVQAHEWISLLFLVPILVHLILHWDWIVGLPGRIANAQPGAWRWNAVLDLVLYALMCFATVSGILASRFALPALGIPIDDDPFWTSTHHKYSNFLYPFVGVHLGLHWPWIKHAVSSFRQTTGDSNSATEPAQGNAQGRP